MPTLDDVMASLGPTQRAEARKLLRPAPKPEPQEPARVIRWEEPTPGRHRGNLGVGRSRYEAVAAELRANPGRWALIYEAEGDSRAALATHIRMGQVQCFSPCGDFDAVSRRIEGVERVYARYVGDGEVGDV